MKASNIAVNQQKKQGASVHAAKMPGSDFFFQPKLSVNQPNDVYEQEADAVADKVMRMAIGSEPQKQTFFKPAVTAVNRKCQHCEEEEKLQRKENSEAEVQGSHQLDSYVGSLASSGQSLSASNRRFFEPRFGRDFSDVKIHTDAVAAKSAQSINALAYTSGNHIVFNSGQYAPESESGKKLMAHELTHVVQQGATGGRVQKQDAVPAAPPDVNMIDGLIKAGKWQDAYDKLSPLGDDAVLDILIKLKDIVDASNFSLLTLLKRNKPAGVQARFDTLIFRADNFVDIMNPLHADELNGTKDKLATQTFMAIGDPIPDVVVKDHQEANKLPVKETFEKEFSIFLPKGLPANRNQVHIFFTPFVASNPDAAAGSIAQQGLRAQSDASGWILIGVPALGEKDIPNFVTITTAEIKTCLKAAGRSDTIDAIRLSAHSRGHRGLENTMGLRAGSKPLIDLGLVEKITVFDASYHDLGQAINSHKKELTAMADPNDPGKFKVGAVQLYDVTVANISGFKGTRLDARSIRALSYARLIQEGLSKGGISTADLSVLPQNIQDATNKILGILAARGTFSTKDPVPTGQTSMQQFYKDNHDDLMLIDSKEVKAFVGTKKLDEGQMFNIDIDAHHWFVAELAHEAVE